MIGCADVLRGYPDRPRAVIGLLLLTEQWQRQGLGRAFARLVEQAIAAWPEIERLRIGVISTNPGALEFWHKLGYVKTGEVRSGAPDFRGDIIALEKPVARAEGGP
jgi:RimJ/RimL family protein N-acetyltransferase